jgi:hypothetical protein
MRALLKRQYAERIPTEDSCCQTNGNPTLITEIAGQPTCCAQKPQADSPDSICCQSPTVARQPADPTRQIVFKVEGLTCPAVKGLGCGHRIAPVLARLNKIDGVEKSLSNRTGTMIRVALTPTAVRDEITAAVHEHLTTSHCKPAPIEGDDLKAAMVKEQWNTPGELSAVEFRTLAVRRVKKFAEGEKLDKEATDRLVKLAEREWDRAAKGVDGSEKTKHPTDWHAHYKQFIAALLDHAKEVVATEQAERLKQSLDR